MFKANVANISSITIKQVICAIQQYNVVFLFKVEVFIDYIAVVEYLPLGRIRKCFKVSLSVQENTTLLSLSMTPSESDNFLSQFFAIPKTLFVRLILFSQRRQRQRPTCLASSVTRLGDLLDFGQLFKAFGNNKFVQISHILRQFL